MGRLSIGRTNEKAYPKVLKGLQLQDQPKTKPGFNVYLFVMHRIMVLIADADRFWEVDGCPVMLYQKNDM
jgi:hypothetical protein